MRIHPLALEPGDIVGLVAPASPPKDPVYVDKTIAAIEKRGFRVLEGSFLRRRHGYLAGSDKERAKDLMAMFSNPRIKAVFCLRGGYGSARLLPFLDFNRIAQSKKILLGCSDITALHAAILAKTRLVTFHGPVATSLVEGLNSFSWEALERSIMQAAAPGSVFQGLKKKRRDLEIIRRGEACGEIIGGNLSILASLMGTSFLPSFKGKILLMEDVGEAPYRIDRLLTQFLNAGLLEELAGIAVGAFTACDDAAPRKPKEYTQDVSDVLNERLYPLKIPVLKGVPVGHQSCNACIPLGSRVRLCAGKASDLILEEPAVSF